MGAGSPRCDLLYVHNFFADGCGDFRAMSENGDKLERLVAAAGATTRRPHTPVDKGHFGITIDAEGVWSHGGTVFPRLALAKLFARVLKRDDAGQYWLETPVEKGLVDVADAPFVAVELAATGVGTDQAVRFRTNLDEWAPLDDDHPLRIETDPETGEPRPYITIRPGLDARLLRPVFYDLADLAVEAPAGDVMGVWSHGRLHEIGPMDDDA